VQNQKKQYYTQLDSLRAIAVIGVFVSHWIPLDIVKKMGFGFWGVNLFFVLSGFLITEILLKEIKSGKPAQQILKSFYYRRILRIFPIYYLVVVLAFIFNLDQSRDFSFYTFTYTLNIYNSVTGDIGLYLSHIWSLCVEEQFYLLWPFLLMLVKPRYHLQLIIATIIGAVAFRLFLYTIDFSNHSIYNYRMMPACMDALGLGGLLAYLKLYKPAILNTILKFSLLSILPIILYLFIEFSKKENLPFWANESLLRTLASLVSFFAIGKAIFGYKNWIGTFLEMNCMQYLGKISYGLYLYHLIISTLLINSLESFIKTNILQFVPEIFKYNLYVFTAPVYFLLTVAVASLSYYIIEKPFLKLKDKYNFKWIPELNSA